MRSRTVVLGIIGLSLAAASPVSAANAKAVIQGTGNYPNLKGEATLTDTDSGLLIEGNLTGAPQGLHGFHIHEFGACDDNGNAAGSHFNPGNTKHGNLVQDGPQAAHAGDLGNIKVEPDGSAKWLYTIPGVTLTNGERAVAGRAFIVHEKPDDFGQPTGNAGGRIACGPILLTKGNGAKP